MNEPQPTTRREFLRYGTALVGFGATVPGFLASTVRAMAATQRAGGARGGGSDGRVLVVLHLAGGNDGLNTLVPYRNDDYYRARPRLAIAADRILRIDDELGWNPGATGFQTLWDAGRLGVVQGVGYPNPNRSHFVSARIWETASPDGGQYRGWLGRYFDNECRGSSSPDPTCGIAVSDDVPLAMRGERFTPISTSRPESFGMASGPPRGNRRKKRRRRGLAPLVPEPGPDSGGNLDFLRRAALDAVAASADIRAAAGRAIDGARFPQTQFARKMRSVARMIASGMPTSVYYVSLSGFDTHANQAPRQERLLRETGEGLVALADALTRTGDLSRTLVMLFSEFGRRVAQNASGGTDHGQAGPMFLMGGAAQPGLHGSHPRLDRLSDGDLTYEIDFRQVYATVLRDWLGADPNVLLGGRWASLPLLRT